MSIVTPGPSSSDPFGQDKDALGHQLVDAVLNKLDLADAIQLALNKANADESQDREQKLIITKLEEAQLWMFQKQRNRRTAR